MGVSIGSRLKAIALFIFIASVFLAAFTITQPAKVHANANLTAYLSVPPTDWEPLGYNQTGTAPWFIVQTLGWTPSKIMGNVGIGDGSTRALNNSSNQDVNYTANNFMAADMSMAPWDPSRLTSVSTPPGAATEAGNTTAAGNASGTVGTSNNSTSNVGNNTSTGSNIVSIPNIGDITLTTPAFTGHNNYSLSIPDDNAEANNTTSSSNNASTQEANNTTTTGNTGTVSFNKPLNDPYHSITMGRPVDDLLYEYPLATTICAYARLTGLMMPCGSCANIAIKCLGYGY